ncbi:MAG TPA: cation diffusion facilitator family transporter [Gaiellales bacterium]|nr:cation diffusion facilitator family transporter [Gaiellales bacterium]
MSHTATCHLDPAHTHEHEHDDHGHSHGLVDESIKRSREGLRVVVLTLGILAVTAFIQGAIYLATGSIALLADLIHNFGDALTALPLGIAFALRSAKAERYAGLAVVLTILASAVVAGAFAVEKLITRQPPTHLLALAAAGVVGIAGNAIAAQIRSTAGRRLSSPALIADGAHARSDALVSAGVVLSAAMVWAGFAIADPIIGLVITVLILHITRESWHTVRGDPAHEH